MSISMPVAPAALHHISVCQLNQCHGLCRTHSHLKVAMLHSKQCSMIICSTCDDIRDVLMNHYVACVDLHCQVYGCRNHRLAMSLISPRMPSIVSRLPPRLPSCAKASTGTAATVITTSNEAVVIIPSRPDVVDDTLRPPSPDKRVLIPIARRAKRKKFYSKKMRGNYRCSKCGNRKYRRHSCPSSSGSVGDNEEEEGCCDEEEEDDNGSDIDMDFNNGSDRDQGDRIRNHEEGGYFQNEANEIVAEVKLILADEEEQTARIKEE